MEQISKKIKGHQLENLTTSAAEATQNIARFIYVLKLGQNHKVSLFPPEIATKERDESSKFPVGHPIFPAYLIRRSVRKRTAFV